MDLAALRAHLMAQGLAEADLDPDPFRQFDTWYRLAAEAGLWLPDAMTLATCTPDGAPSARVVLLKGFTQDGFSFFTNYDSRKGRELEANPRAALVFWWGELERQVRAEGRVGRVTAAESDVYFQTRPRGSQLGALASRQSEILAGRAELDRRVAELQARYGDGPVPRPPGWGGYRLRPDVIEFWQGRPDRLHDRLCYVRLAGGGWQVRRLAP